MIKVEIGTVLNKADIKQGQTKDGIAWMLGTVKASKGYDTIKVWASNPDAMSNRDCNFKIVEIIEASIKNRKYTTKAGTEKWVAEYSVVARFEPTEENSIPSDEDKQSATPEGFSILESDIPF